MSTTVFKVLVFETPALFLIFSDYGHICFWNYMLQLLKLLMFLKWCLLPTALLTLCSQQCKHSKTKSASYLFTQSSFLIRWLPFFLLWLLYEPYRTFGTTSFTRHLIPTTTDWITYQMHKRWISTQDSYNSKLKDYFTNNKKA